MKVVAVVVTPPDKVASGAIEAALKLSLALTDLCDLRILQMAAENSSRTRGKLVQENVQADLPLKPLLGALPQKLQTQFIGSAIPEMIRRSDCDLVHIHNQNPALEMQRVAKACLSAGKPYVVSTHGFVETFSDAFVDYHKNAGRYLKVLARKHLCVTPVQVVATKANSVFALSEAELPILERIGVHGDKIRIVPNGVDIPAEPRTDPLVLDRLRARYKIPQDIPVCFFLANHEWNKGLPVLLEAMTRVTSPFVLLIGGKKSDQLDYGQYEAKLKDRQSFVTTGFLTDEDRDAIYSLSDLFVFPTLADTFPLVLLEAMAHRLAILSTRVGGIPHMVNDQCGQLVEPGDPGALAQQLDDLLSDRLNLKELGANAYKHAQEQFSWRLAAEKAYDAYSHVLQER